MGRVRCARCDREYDWYETYNGVQVVHMIMGSDAKRVKQCECGWEFKHGFTIIEERKVGYGTEGTSDPGPISV